MCGAHRNTWYPSDIKQMFMGFIIILFAFDSTPKTNNKGCREKEMEGDKEGRRQKEDTQKENDICSLRALC